MASAIVRLDYFSQSIVVDLSLLCYIRLDIKQIGRVSKKEMRFSFLDSVGSAESLFQHTSDKKGEELTRIYLDLFTQWRNYNNEAQQKTMNFFSED